MRNQSVLMLAIIMVGSTLSSVEAVPVQWASHSDGWVHYYERIDISGTWNNAEQAAEALSWMGEGGYLVTITSPEEQDFISTNFLDGSGNIYIGGYQPDGSPEPDGNWQWITGETWDYENWHPSEPTNSTSPQGWDEDVVMMWNNGAAFDGTWNDIPHESTGATSFIVEYSVPEPVLVVDIDIEPGSCPNPVDVKSSGVLPIAILGTDDYDVTTIDIASIRLAGVEPIRSGYEDVATPVSDSNDCNCTTDGPDGFLDLTLKFKTQRIVEAIGNVNDGDVRVLTLTGVLYDPIPFETPIEGADCILIRGRHKPINPADINKDGTVDMADFALIAENWLQSSIVDE